MTPEQAADRIVEAMDEASLHKVSAAGRAWLLEWCLRAGRPEMLADEQGEADIAALCRIIARNAGPMLNGMTHLTAKVSRDPDVTGEAVDPPMIAALELILSLSRTRLCTRLERLMGRS